jgi:hypothetical protein
MMHKFLKNIQGGFSMYISVIRMANKKLKKTDKADLIMKGVIVGVTVFLLLNQNVYAADAVTTGMGKLDAGAWKIVKVFQSGIFWLSMIYSFRAMLELALRGEGNWKKVGTGFAICAGDYLIPWLFTIIRDSFA